ncbi:unnamed protein product [Lepeophtheirus salmonis]|uniref:(salmon louse) hypothetical protein n=1 Tax=Lepeophtheirus salmonis TaxID=72036 RepID=A0A0K2TQ55_LEPSM|nr:uncharacterized protein LOC121114278 [Lepeophtheirus salmonis]CAB4062246.1 unnamed protein product [Lepeophtheirus salmonis]CAF2899361.1 unnamed protein product [Lepeophtheirus salmonis]
MYKSLSILILFTIQATFGQSCQPGVCSSILGTVYDEVLDQCAWPDEVGCFVQDLGINENCDGYNAYELKALSSDIPNLPQNRYIQQYFVVCLPMLTEEDKLQEIPIATGPIAPRLLGCPEYHEFDPNTNTCIDTRNFN